MLELLIGCLFFITVMGWAIIGLFVTIAKFLFRKK